MINRDGQRISSEARTPPGPETQRPPRGETIGPGTEDAKTLEGHYCFQYVQTGERCTSQRAQILFKCLVYEQLEETKPKRCGKNTQSATVVAM